MDEVVKLLLILLIDIVAYISLKKYLHRVITQNKIIRDIQDKMNKKYKIILYLLRKVTTTTNLQEKHSLLYKCFKIINKEIKMYETMILSLSTIYNQKFQFDKRIEKLNISKSYIIKGLKNTT